jgi:hypothetical protein
MNIFKQGDSFLQQLTKVKHVSIVTFFVAFLEATISPILPEAFLLVLLAYRKDLSWERGRRCSMDFCPNLIPILFFLLLVRNGEH